MDKVLEIVKWAVESGPHFITALGGVVSALIVLALLIPGDQPEKTLQKLADFLAKFSRKP